MTRGADFADHALAGAGPLRHEEEASVPDPIYTPVPRARAILIAPTHADSVPVLVRETVLPARESCRPFADDELTITGL